MAARAHFDKARGNTYQSGWRRVIKLQQSSDEAV